MPAAGPESPGDLQIRRATRGDLEQLHAVAWYSFAAEVAPHYTSDGIEEYRHFCSVASLEERMALGHDFWMAVNQKDEAVAMAEVRDEIHLAMLFVQPAAKGRGIGSTMLDWVKGRARGSMTVCASVNAVGFYSKHGFEATGPEQDESGIRFVPMRAG